MMPGNPVILSETDNAASEFDAQGFYDCSMSYDEVEERNLALGWNVQYRQLKPQEYSGYLCTRELGDIGLMMESFGVKTEMSGEGPRDDLLIVFTTSPHGQEMHLNGVNTQSQSVLLMPPGSEVHAVASEHTYAGQLFLNPLETLRIWESLAPGLELFCDSDQRAVELTPEQVSIIQNEIVWLIANETSGRPAADEFLAGMMGLLAQQALLSAGKRSSLHLSGQRKKLWQARDYIEGNLDRSLLVPELCAHLGVSVSSLERLFRKYYGITPANYIHLRRLHDCRDRLKVCDPSETSVGSIMKSCGVGHPGRFASDYAVFFGESPKQTLGYLR